MGHRANLHLWRACTGNLGRLGGWAVVAYPSAGGLVVAVAGHWSVALDRFERHAAVGVLSGAGLLWAAAGRWCLGLDSVVVLG